MSERLTAQLGDNFICAFELLDLNGQYLEEERSRIRAASQSGELVCPECSGRLILCAGAVREPYFRHYSSERCIATVEMRTKAGKRRYVCRKMLYNLAKSSGCSDITLVENSKQLGSKNPLSPVLFKTNEGLAGYVFLDGKSRNYLELKKAAREYKSQGAKLLFFLSMKNMSEGKNITSDEAEIAKLNEGIVYYIDDVNGCIAMRKQYEGIEHVQRYFTKVYKSEELRATSNGEMHADFLQDYEKLVQAEKRRFAQVLRVPIEDGIDEVYFGMDYVCMDSVEEIWILPEFLHWMENDEQAKEKRLAYLEEMNAALWEMEPQERYVSAFTLAKEVGKRRNSWEW